MESSRFVSSDLPEAIIKFNRKLIFSRNNQVCAEVRLIWSNFKAKKKIICDYLPQSPSIYKWQFVENSWVYGFKALSPFSLWDPPLLGYPGGESWNKGKSNWARKTLAVNFPLEFPPKVSLRFDFPSMGGVFIQETRFRGNVSLAGGFLRILSR